MLIYKKTYIQGLFFTYQRNFKKENYCEIYFKNNFGRITTEIS